MKKIILGLALMITLGTQAQAAWQCRAHPYGYGYGWVGYNFYYLNDAKASALDVCNYNTGQACYIEKCWTVW